MLEKQADSAVSSTQTHIFMVSLCGRQGKSPNKLTVNSFSCQQFFSVCKKTKQKKRKHCQNSQFTKIKYILFRLSGNCLRLHSYTLCIFIVNIYSKVGVRPKLLTDHKKYHFALTSKIICFLKESNKNKTPSSSSFLVKWR